MSEYLGVNQLVGEDITKASVILHLSRALDNHEFFVAYQPIIDLETRKPIKIEALLRWQHPTLGELPCSEFFYFLEHKPELLLDISTWMLKQTCHEFAAFKKITHADILLSLNLTPQQLLDPEITQDILTVFKRNELSPNKIIFEVQQSYIINKREMITKILEVFNHMRLNISIKNVSINYFLSELLNTFLIESIKLEKNLVHHAPHSTEKFNELKETLHLAASREIPVIAVGIESNTQLKPLEKACCPQGQGNLFAPPMRLKTLIDYITINNNP